MKRKLSVAVLILWAALSVTAWFAPAKAMSDAERRPLAQMPEPGIQSILNGSFMTDFEDYSLDQFPLRDGLRTIKSLFHYYVLGQKDNNGIYLSDGYAAQQEYPLNKASVQHALERFQHLYHRYLEDSDVYMAIVPDKGYYLAGKSGNLAMDYEKLFSLFADGMPWAAQIDLTQVLSLQDYYRTDTHWRQENLIPAAGAICEALGMPAPRESEFGIATMEPFYGVYYGQAALPMEPDEISWLVNETLDSCSVYDFESGKYQGIYDESKLRGKDPYELFLSGSRSLLTIENPNAKTDRELIIFRDSFGSAIAPLLISDYAKVTLVDIRYIQIDVLDRFIEFHGQDVLFLYSTLVLNNSETIK